MRALLVAAAAGLAAVLSSPPGAKPGPHWLGKVTITEYYPAPERWFSGRRVKAPDLPGRHRVDWLYSSSGVAMEGDGVGLDGRRYHLATAGPKAWVTEDGKATIPRKRGGGWTRGWPFWRTGGWRNAQHQVTFPLTEAAGTTAAASATSSPSRFASRPGPRAR